MKYIVSILFLGLSLGQISAQSITLEGAILGQGSVYRPMTYQGIQWIGDSQDKAYFSNYYSEIHRLKPGSKDPEKIITLADIKQSCDDEIAHLWGTEFKDNQTAIIHTKSAYYEYNFEDKKATKILGFPANAENKTLNGNLLAYTLKNNLYLADAGHTKIPVTKFRDKNIVSGQAIARSEFGITGGIFWSPSGKHLAFYQKNEKEVADYPLLDITATPGELKSIKYPMAGQKSENARIGIYNIETKSTIYLKVEGDMEQYLTNFAWGPNEAFVYVAIVNRDQDHMQLVQFNASTGAMNNILFEEKHPKYVEPENPAWFIPGKDDQFIWMSERDGFMHLYLYNTEGKQLKQLTSGKWVVKQILGTDNKNKNVIIETTDESGLNTVARSVNLKSGKSIVISKGEGVHHFDLNPNGIHMIDEYSNVETPGVQRVIDTKGKLIEPLITAKSPFKPGEIGTTELVTLKAGDDGTPLHARMIKPANFDPGKKYPVLVYVYGGPHAQMVTNSWLGGASLWMHYMANKGYIIWTLDNRGSANRGRDFENIIHRQLGTVEMEDQLVGVKFLKAQDYVDDTKMAVHGWSFGGFMTTSLMLRKAGTFKVGVAGGPVTDWKYYEIMYGERYMDRPEQNKEGYADASLLNHADKLEGDLLLIHGTVDDVVVMQHNLSLVKAFVDNGILVDFFPYPNHPHNVRGKDRVHLYKKVLTYIEDKLNH